MCEQGRILHHLRNNIEDPRNTVLITGFQAQDTLGRKLVEKWPEVRIFGEPMRVRAEISSLDELSGARRPGRADGVDPAAGAIACARSFWCMASPSSPQTLAKLLHSTYNLNVAIPAPGQSFDLA